MLASIARSIQTITAGGDILGCASNEHVVDIVVDSVPTLTPRLTAIVAEMHAADFDACDDAVWRVRMRIEAPDMRFVSMSRSEPFLARGKFLEPLELAPRRARVLADVEVGGMRPRVQPLAIGTRTNRVDFITRDVEVGPRFSAVR